MNECVDGEYQAFKKQRVVRMSEKIFWKEQRTERIGFQ